MIKIWDGFDWISTNGNPTRFDIQIFEEDSVWVRPNGEFNSYMITCIGRGGHGGNGGSGVGTPGGGGSSGELITAFGSFNSLPESAWITVSSYAEFGSESSSFLGDGLTLEASPGVQGGYNGLGGGTPTESYLDLRSRSVSPGSNGASPIISPQSPGCGGGGGGNAGGLAFNGVTYGGASGIGGGKVSPIYIDSPINGANGDSVLFPFVCGGGGSGGSNGVIIDNGVAVICNDGGNGGDGGWPGGGGGGGGLGVLGGAGGVGANGSVLVMCFMADEFSPYGYSS